MFLEFRFEPEQHFIHRCRPDTGILPQPAKTLLRQHHRRLAHGQDITVAPQENRAHAGCPDIDAEGRFAHLPLRSAMANMPDAVASSVMSMSTMPPLSAPCRISVLSIPPDATMTQGTDLSSSGDKAMARLFNG